MPSCVPHIQVPATGKLNLEDQYNPARTAMADFRIGDDGDRIGERRLLADRLHRTELGGVPFKILIAGMGFVVAMLSLTGVRIWLRKQSAKLRSETKRFRAIVE